MKALQPVLYVEDDDDALFLMKHAFTKLGISNPLHNVSDGKKAVAYLSGIAPYEGREIPCLCLLDLNMPGWHGLDVLKWIRSEPSFAHLPVIVLTSSNQHSDIHRAYLLGADGYMIKPGNLHELLRKVKIIQDYWLTGHSPREKFIDFACALVVPPPKSTLENDYE